MTLIIDIKVIPSSGKQKIILDKSEQLKCYLKSAPEGGKANAELIKFLAKKLGLTKSGVEILLGKTARKKRIKINLEINFNELLEKLGVERQQKVF